MNWIKETVLPRFKAFVKRDEPEEILWVKCKSCLQMIFHKEFHESNNVCKTCGYHDHLSAKKRIEFIFDKDSIENISIPKLNTDPLKFKDKKKYSDRLQETQNKTKLDDALLVSFGSIHNIPLVIACFDFSFMAGSMGRQVGNGLILASEEAIKRKCSLRGLDEHARGETPHHAPGALEELHADDAPREELPVAVRVPFFVQEPEAAQLRENNTNTSLETLRALLFLDSTLKDT